MMSNPGSVVCGPLVVLKPKLVPSSIILTGREWVVNDPVGRWRGYDKAYVTSPNASYCEFTVGEGEDRCSFRIHTKKHLWVLQEKDQFIVRRSWALGSR